MYVSFMLEEYGKETFRVQGTKEEIQMAVDLLGDTINQIIADGGTVSQELRDTYARLKESLALYNDYTSICDNVHEIVRILYSQTMEQALTDAGADRETIDGIAKGENSSNITRALTHMLFRDELQTETGDKVISFERVGKQMKHFATFIGNAGSFMRPHNNEVILSWLRTQDPTYDDFAKETDVQKLGYRRVFISSTGSADVTGTVRDDSGNKVAAFKNGILLSSSDPWVAVTTCDTGNWLRLPIEKGYNIDLKVSGKTNLPLTIKAYSVYDGKTVRTVTKDKKYSWKNLSVVKGDRIKWVLPPAAKNGKSKLPSGVYNYIKLKKVAPGKVKSRTYVRAGKKAIIVNWKKDKKATGYKVCIARNKAMTKSLKVVTVKGKNKKSRTIRNLKKGTRYYVQVRAIRPKGKTEYTGSSATKSAKVR